MSKTKLKDLHKLCKNETDHRFVDAMESISIEFEKPREQLDPFRFMLPIS